MKKALTILFANIALFLFFYLTVSFYSVSFNIKDWTEGARFAVVMLYTPIGFLMSIYLIGELNP